MTLCEQTLYTVHVFEVHSGDNQVSVGENAVNCAFVVLALRRSSWLIVMKGGTPYRCSASPAGDHDRFVLSMIVLKSGVHRRHRADRPNC